MNKEELDENLEKLEQKGIITIDKKENDDDTLITMTPFGKWLENMGMQQTYLAMPELHQKIMRSAYEDPNGQFDPSVFEQ